MTEKEQEVNETGSAGLTRTSGAETEERGLEEELRKAGIVLTKQIYSETTGWHITGVIPNERGDLTNSFLLEGLGKSRLNALKAVKVKAVATYGSTILVGE
jgi:hypothetical protein